MYYSVKWSFIYFHERPRFVEMFLLFCVAVGDTRRYSARGYHRPEEMLRRWRG